MSIEPTKQLKLIADFFNTIPDFLGTVRGVSQTQFARELLSFFEIIETLEPKISDVIFDLNEFTEEPTIGMRVHFIHRAGEKINAFSNACTNTVDWLRNHSHWNDAFAKIAKKMLEKFYKTQSQKMSMHI